MKISYKKVLTTTLATLLLSTATAPLAYAASHIFPVIGPATFTNDFLAARGNDVHHATDIFADKHSPIVSRVDGTIRFVAYPEPSWGYGVFIDGDNGITYNYIHLNNDTPGTDNGSGGGYHAYGPDIEPGKRVSRGQLLGYLGDSGNAEDTRPHLHIEAYRGDDPRNLYNSLLNSSKTVSQPNTGYPKADNEILPVGTGFTGGVRVALGDLDDDGEDEIISGSGRGGRLLRVFEQDGTLLKTFAPNGVNFLGGVDVAAGDVDGDGIDEIITGAGEGGRFVKAFTLDGTLIARFPVRENNERNGIRVAVGDIDNDGDNEIITGDNAGGSTVQVFELDGTNILTFEPYGPSFEGGINVAAGDIRGDEAAEIVTGAGPSAGPRVNIHSGDGTELDTFNAYRSSFGGGVEVAVANIDGAEKAQLFTTAATNGSPRIKSFNADGTYRGYSNYYAETYWRGTYSIAVSDSTQVGTLGVDRRSSIRPVDGL